MWTTYSSYALRIRTCIKCLIFNSVHACTESLSHVRLFETPWTVARQALLSLGFPRQEYWSGLPFPSPEDLPDPGIEPRSPAFQADTLTSEPPGKPMGVTKSHIQLSDFHPNVHCSTIYFFLLLH